MKTVLTDEQEAQFVAKIIEYGTEFVAPLFSVVASIEQAVLKSPEIQALRKDAERYRKLSAMATQQADSLGPIFRIDVRRSAPYLFNFDAAIDAAMEKQT